MPLISLDPKDNPDYRQAVVDILGALAYAELTAFSRLAADAELAPSLPERAALARQSAVEFHHFDLLSGRLAQLGADADLAMLAFVPAIDRFHDRTRPSSWLEGLVKAFVGGGIAADFYRELAAYLDSDTAALVTEVVDDLGQGEFAIRAVREAIAAQPAVAGRLALWGRRLVGEALAQAQQVATERSALAQLLILAGLSGGGDLVAIHEMFARITAAHTRRMAALGLAA